MSVSSILETARLRLRPYEETDIPDLVALIGVREVAATTLRIPHPYTERDARDFLAAIVRGGEIRHAVTLRDDDRLIGGIGLAVEEPQQRAELGYWLGVPYWGRGYATEAAQEMIRFGFEEIGLNRIFASHFEHNPASGRVLRKLGMRYEGCQRGHIVKWDRKVDLELYGILQSDWQSRVK
jgi:RimJ/RimL family protein N-acetyltransferase